MSEPFLEVVICTYNHAPLLDRVLDALAVQHEADASWAVLVVDNNCTDATPTIVERHIASGTVPGLRRIVETEQGLTPARRRGVFATSVPWIAFVDDDCLLAEDWIAQAVAFLRAHPNIGGMGGRVVLEWEDEPPGYVFGYKGMLAEQDRGDEPTTVESLAGAGMVIRREALHDSGWLDRPLLDDRIGERLVSGGDVELTLRVRAAGYPLWYNPACTLRHVIGHDRTSRRYLTRLNYGLGMSDTLVSALVWEDDYASWRDATRQKLRRRSGEVVRQVGRAVRRRRALTSALFDASFVSGRYAGLRHVERMPRVERERLIGCASPAVEEVTDHV